MLDLRSLIPWGQQKAGVPSRKEDYRDPFVAFRREMDRLFDDFFRGSDGFGSRALGGLDDNWFGGVPTIDVTDSDKELVVSAELPGVDQKDIDVTLSGDVLTISGEKKHEYKEPEQKEGKEGGEGGHRYVERRYGSFSRSVRLPFEAGEQDVKADFDKGVLTIRIPKPTEAQGKVKKIDVNAH